MSEVAERCTVCHALLDEEDLFCANCGAEAPNRAPAGDAAADRVPRFRFDCQGCGASMGYDARSQSLRCPFCGSEKLDERPAEKALVPRRVVPFAVGQSQADAILRQWLGRGFWRPDDLVHAAQVVQMTPVYVPYWMFEARTFTYWTADTNQLPPGARGDWRPLFGEHRGSYAGLLIGASSVLTPNETAAISPFDFAQAVPYAEIDLGGAAVEQFRVARKYARPLAVGALEDCERTACRVYVPGNQRNLKVNVRLEGLSSEPVLVPAWVMAYRYQDDVFRFLINGQTGKTTGTAPVSYFKVAVAVVIGLGVLLAGLASLAALAAAASR